MTQNSKKMRREVEVDDEEIVQPEEVTEILEEEEEMEEVVEEIELDLSSNNGMNADAATASRDEI
jgi:hypothetical protein